MSDLRSWSDKELLAALSILKPGDPTYEAAVTEAARRANETGEK
jgi:hypothetical protein